MSKAAVIMQPAAPKQAKMSLWKKLLIATLLLAVVLGVGITILGIIIFETFSTPFTAYNKVVAHVQKQYSHITIPPDFTLQTTTTQGDPIDISLDQAGKEYSYTYSQADRIAHDNFKQAILGQDYTVLVDDGTDLQVSNSASNLKLKAVFGHSALTVDATEVKVSE